MDKRIREKIERIAETNLLTNKWMRWCEQRLPEQSIHAPSVFQFRDAFSHIMTMYALGLEEQGLADRASDDGVFDELVLYGSRTTERQLDEAAGHVLRAFFDTADYIQIRLAQLSELKEGTNGKPCYPTLRRVLNSYDSEISELRARKSLPIEIEFEAVTAWDGILQILTTAFSLSNYEEEVMELKRTVANLYADIEKYYSEDIIKDYSDKFFKIRKDLKKEEYFSSEYQEIMEHPEVLKIKLIEDPDGWQTQLTQFFIERKKELNVLKKDGEALLQALPETALIRDNRKKANIGWIVEAALSSIISKTVELYLFSHNESNMILLQPICFLVLFVVLFASLDWLRRKLSYIISKKKYRMRKL